MNIRFQLKRTYVLLSLLCISCAIYSLTPEEHEFSGLRLEYSYFGIPLKIDVGHEYRKADNLLYFPIIGLSMESTRSAFNLFLNTSLVYRYKRFYTELGFKQGLIPYTGRFSDYNSFQSYGWFESGYYFSYVHFSVASEFGNMYSIDKSNYKKETTFQNNYWVTLAGMLIDDEKNSLSSELSSRFDITPFENQFSYEVSAKMNYTFFHYHGQFGIRPIVSYFQYFNNSQKNYVIGSTYLSSINMFSVTPNPNNNTYYNFLSSVHAEYKYFFRTIPNALRSLYIVGFGNIGYGKELEYSFSDGRLLYCFGAGVGFSLFGSAPLQLTVGFDQSKNITLNFMVSTILHSF